MIKFVLISVTAVLMILGIYTYSNQTSEKSSPIPSISSKKKEIKTTEKISVVAQEVNEKKSSGKNIVMNPPSIISQETIQEVETETGKGLTLESIENTNVSDEEKEQMRDDMIYYQGVNAEPSEPLSEEEVLKMIEEDFKVK